MIKMEGENGIEANKVGKKVKGRKIRILSEQQNRKRGDIYNVTNSD
jgi:hypothetical protein